MARKATITDEQILEAARWVFLQRGIAGTVAEVAKSAGIAEGSVFTRFPTKEALFRAALEPKHEELGWLDVFDRDDADAKRTLAEAARRALAFFRRIIPSMIMMWSQARGLPEPLRREDPLPLQALRRVIAWLERQMAAGRMRRQDPEVLARVFVGSMQSYAFFELLLRAHRREVFDADRYVDGFVEQFWNGAAPPRKKR